MIELVNPMLVRWVESEVSKPNSRAFTIVSPAFLWKNFVIMIFNNDMLGLLMDNNGSLNKSKTKHGREKMGTVTLVIAILAVTSLLIGVVATIVSKLDTVPNWRKVCKVLYWIIGILIFKLVVWGTYDSYKKDVHMVSPATSSGIATMQPREEWVFEWQLLPGKMDGGRNKHTLQVEITKNDTKELWAVLHDKQNGQDVSVGGLRLGKVGNDLIGTWSNYLDGDGGNCYLYKRSGGWSGHYKLRDGSRTDCTLEVR